MNEKTLKQWPEIGTILMFTYGPHDVPASHARLVGQSRPAFVVAVWPDEFDGKGGYNVQVLTDGSNDGPGKEGGTYWATSRSLNDTPTPGHLHCTMLAIENAPAT